MKQKWTSNTIQADAREQNVRFIRLMFSDIAGILKNVEIPISQLPKALNNEMSFDGSSIEGFSRIEESDMYLVPDVNTWIVYDWDKDHPEPARVASLICDIETPEKEPFAGDPRTNLKRVLKEMYDLGFTEFNLGPEPEFFLFKMDEIGQPTASLNDAGGYFDLAPTDLAENCRRDIVLELESLGFEIEASHHEVAKGQHEIDWKYADAVTASDNIQLFKYVVKSVARKYNLHATFMPKPVYGINGSGMHFNVSLFNENGNAFYDPDTEDGLSQTARYFIAGLLHYASGFTAITNPLVNSYKRLVPGYEAPVYIAWSESNRSPLVRIPAARGKSTRIELRSVDPSANPYLALAVILKAGLQGIKDHLEVPAPVVKNIYDMSAQQMDDEAIKKLPASLREAVAILDHTPLIKEALGEHITTKFIAAKQHEYDRYASQVTQWEIDEYLSSY